MKGLTMNCMRSLVLLLFGLSASLGAVTVKVDAGHVLHQVGPEAFALNLTSDHLNNFSEYSRKLWRQLGVRILRWPGGSDSDTFDFSAAPDGGHASVAKFAELAESIGAQSYVTLNFGSGSPAMAAAFVAYLNGRPEDATKLGKGKRPKPGAKDWDDFDWKTAGFWAALRGQGPLAADDGYNFLRVGHPRPWGVRYFEVGNECYGSWERDLRPQKQKASPVLYAQFTGDAMALIKKVDLMAQVGVIVMVDEDRSWRNADSAPYAPVVNPATGQSHHGWTAILLSHLARASVIPDFLVDHYYPVSPGNENDAQLLSIVSPPSTASDQFGPLSWEERALRYRSYLNQYFGQAKAARIAIRNTEYNSAASNPGKQSVSIVGGLFYADSFGAALRTEIGGFTWWLARSSANKGNMSEKLYGWRIYGDYGLMGEDGYIDDGSPFKPGRTSTTPYPGFFAAQLAGLYAHEGDSIVQASSDEPSLAAYACLQKRGNLALLLVNKSPDKDQALSFDISGYNAAPAGALYQYGKAQDTAQSHGAAVSISVSAANLASVTLPAYSMSVLLFNRKKP